jgi:hypothetical protein
MQTKLIKGLICAGVASISVFTGLSAEASSHREAPFIAGMPRVDGTDFYMFRSYEAGRENYVTLIANYIPLQAPYGGPNYFDMDTNAIYEIHVDNNGDAAEDITFRFKFQDVTQNLKVNVGGQDVAVPLKNIGAIGPNAEDTAAVNVRQTYSVEVVKGKRRNANAQKLTHAVDGSSHFRKPLDNIGNKSIANYENYAQKHIYDVAIPNCSNGRVFVGQRKEGFGVNLGEVFDLVNTNPLGPVDGEKNTIDDANITSLALEVPINCLTSGNETVIGAWTTASIRQVSLINPFPNSDKNKPAAIYGGAFTQVSRLGMPLVNEVVIGLKDKDNFNASQPKEDGQFATYVTNPTLPALLEILFKDAGAVAPTQFPRSDLVAAFLTGLDGLNKPANVVASEMLRLNTGVPVKSSDMQSNLGALGGDIAGFPNGRRPGDDVVDIELRVAMGALLDESVAPNKNAPFTDGALVNASQFDTQFPYLKAPLAGSPQY